MTGLKTKNLKNMSKNFVKIIFIVMLFGATFFVTESANSAIMCCEAKRGSEENNLTSINECRLEAVGAQCQTIVKDLCTDDFSFWKIIPAYFLYTKAKLAAECATKVFTGERYFQEDRIVCNSNDICEDALIPKCCLIKSAVTEKGLETATPTSCRLQTTESPCDAKISFTEPYHAGRFYSQEEKVNCTSNPMCKSKVTAQLINCGDYKKDPIRCGDYSSVCFWSLVKGCLSKNDPANCPDLNVTDCKQMAPAGCEFKNNICMDTLAKGISERYETKGDFLPNCAAAGQCRNLSDLFFPVLKFVEWIFKYIGALAFIFFVYGGFTMILSFGNAEKFKKGQQILVAAVIGLIIVFSAYLLVSFLLDALGVAEEFKVIK